MAQSGNILKLLEEHKEDDFNDKDVAPYDVVPLPTDLARLVAEYVWETPLQRPSLFIGVDYLLEKILFLAKHAGSLDVFKHDVTKFLKRELTKKEGCRANVLLDQIITIGNCEGTFVQCLAIGLDRTIRKEYAVCLRSTDINIMHNPIQKGTVYFQVIPNNQLRYFVDTAANEVATDTITAVELKEKNIPQSLDDATLQQCKSKILALTTAKGHTLKDGFEIDKGMTEEFIEIVESLCKEGLLSPTTLQDVKNQVSQVALPEDEKATADRKTAVTQLFDGFVGTDEMTERAITTFKKFVEKMKLDSLNERGYLKDDRYSTGLIYLIGECIAVISKRGNELLDNQWYGQKAERFYYKIIGSFLQIKHSIPERIKQIFIHELGLYSLFEEHKKPSRDPVLPDKYSKRDFHVLGDNSYYDDYGFSQNPEPQSEGDCGPPPVFQYLLQAIATTSRLYAIAATTPSHAAAEPLSSNRTIIPT